MATRQALHRVSGAVAIVLAAFLETSPVSADPFQEELRRRVEALVTGAPIEAGDEPIYSVVTIRDFYERRSFEPAWIAGGKPTRAARDLLETLKKAEVEGLRSTDYHLRLITVGVRPGQTPREAPAAVDLELLLTDAFLLYASHCLAGRLNPETIDPEWHARRREADLAEVLQNALTGRRVGDALAALLPPQQGYANLRDALSRYRAIASAGGWPHVPEGPTMRRGDAGPRVASLRDRLRVESDLVEPDGDDPVFDAATESAVRRFQARHGLETDGLVGAATLAALNVSAQARVQQIVVNLERWRWLPQDLGSRHVLVNIADFHLEAVEAGATARSMRVVVGRDYRRTPVFSDIITYLVLNPSWDVPPRLAVNDYFPQIKDDPDFATRMGFRILQGQGAEEREVDPRSVDWDRMPPGRFPFRLRQMPGPKNALGAIKFMFPNKFNVYLHDTPARALFARPDRAFSSGCIRVERPLDLAEWLLEGQAGWDLAGIRQAVDSGREQTVRLSRRTAVHLLYWTAWVDADDLVRFRKDVYNRDRPVADALGEPAPDFGEGS
jgi:murein L,D-transpeptidase YcbB/YkuD